MRSTRSTSKCPRPGPPSAELRLAGSEYQLTTETQRSVYVLDDHAGTADLGIPAVCAAGDPPAGLGAGDIEFPEISPLGQGAVDAYLGVVNATDRSLTIDNAWDCNRFRLATRFHAGEFATGGGNDRQCVSGQPKVVDSQDSVATGRVFSR